MSEVKNPAIVYISPAELVVHPKLIEIYGENEERPALEKSISEKGILESLKVSARTGVNVVLAGKCRLQIAHKLLISSVKVEFVESGSPEEDLKLVLDFNLHREGGKTHYQKFHEGQYWESVLRPQAKERQRESARRLNESKCSNLNHSINESTSQLKKGKPVIQEVSENLNISVGSYHKGKKVFELISQLRELEKFKAVIALEMEFNRSIDAAYKFVCNQDICYQVIDLLEADEIGSIGDGIAWMLNGDKQSFNPSGYRNPFRRFQLDQVYQFKKRLRPELEIVGRVIGITNEFVVFGLRNLGNMSLEIVNLRPRQIDAELQDEPSASQRKRIFHLMQKFSDVFPVQVSLAELLKLPNLTDKEEVLLRMYESDVFEKTWEDYKTQMKAMEVSTNRKKDKICAA
ncbi:MAG: ParB N-terminal domain-containing protein [Nostoc sp.]